MDKAAPEGAREKSIVIKGSAEAVERAKQLIHEKIGGGGYGGCGGGYGGGRWGLGFGFVMLKYLFNLWIYLKV